MSKLLRKQSNTTTTVSNTSSQNNNKVKDEPYTLFPHIQKKEETYTYTVNTPVVLDMFRRPYQGTPFNLVGRRWRLLFASHDYISPDTNRHDEYMSIYLEALATTPTEEFDLKVDFTLDLLSSTIKGDVVAGATAYSKEFSTEFTPRQSVYGMQTFIKRSELLEIIRPGSVTIRTRLGLGQAEQHNSHLIKLVEPITKLTSNGDHVHRSLVLSFYLLPALRRAILEIPREDEQRGQTISFELQRIFYMLSKGRVVTDIRLTQSISFLNLFSLNSFTMIYDFDKVVPNTLTQVIESSNLSNAEKLKYLFCLGTDDNSETIYTINVDRYARGKLLDHLTYASEQIRELDIYPPVLFITLPMLVMNEASSGRSPYPSEMRTSMIDFPEDFFISDIVSEVDLRDSPTRDNHYVLYSVWVHTHPENSFTGNFYPFVRPLNQPHWIKILDNSVTEVSFPYVKQASIGASPNRLSMAQAATNPNKQDSSYALPPPAKPTYQRPTRPKYDSDQRPTSRSKYDSDEPPPLIYDDPPSLVPDEPPALVPDGPPSLLNDDEEDHKPTSSTQKKKKKSTRNKTRDGRSVVSENDIDMLVKHLVPTDAQELFEQMTKLESQLIKINEKCDRQEIELNKRQEVEGQLHHKIREQATTLEQMEATMEANQKRMAAENRRAQQAVTDQEEAALKSAEQVRKTLEDMRKEINSLRQSANTAKKNSEALTKTYETQAKQLELTKRDLASIRMAKAKVDEELGKSRIEAAKGGRIEELMKEKALVAQLQRENNSLQLANNKLCGDREALQSASGEELFQLSSQLGS
eukprot:gene14162-16691_t